MPIDESQFVSPFLERRAPDPQARADDLVSPFQVAEVAAKMKEADNRIGPVEELEGFLSLTSGIAASAGGGFAAAVTAILEENNLFGTQLGVQPEFQSYETAEDVLEFVQKAGTYVPRTEAGRKFAERLATPFVLMDKAAQYVGDRVYDATESAVTGTTAKTATMMLIPRATVEIGKGTLWTAKQAVSVVSTVAEAGYMMISKTPRKNYSRQAVGESLRENIGESAEVKANIAETKRLAEEIPSYQPTLAETTLKQSIISREARLAEADQATYDVAQVRRTQNIAAVKTFREEHFGNVSQEIATIFRNSKGNIDQALTALEHRMNKLDESRNNLADKSPSMDLEVVGRQLRKIEQEQYLAAKAYGSVLYQKIGDARVDPTPIVNSVKELFASDLLDFAGKDIPSSLNMVKRLLIKEEVVTKGEKTSVGGDKLAEDGTISFETMRSLETRLKQDLAAERGKGNGSKTTERMLTQTIEKIDEVKAAMRKTQDAGVVQALDEATTFWREGVAERFYRGAGRDISAKTAFNEFRVVDEKVIDSFFTTAKTSKGGVKGIDDFINTFGMHPEAWAQLRIGVHQKYREASGVNKTGVIDSNKADVFLNKYRVVLDRIPKIRDELTSISSASKALDITSQMIKQRKVNIEHSILSKTFKSHTPDTIVKSSIKEHGRDMHKLRSAANRVKGGVEALSKAVGREVMKAAERSDGTINSARLLNYMEKNASAIKVGMRFEHYQALKTLHNAYLRMDKTPLPGMVKDPKLGLEKFSEFFGTTPAQAISAWRAKSRGLVGGPHLVAQLGTSFITRINKRQIDAIERIAHYDIEVAKTLMQMSKAKTRVPKSVEVRLFKYLAEYGIVGLAISSEEPVKE